MPTVGAMGENSGSRGVCTRKADVVAGSLARNALPALIERGITLAVPSARHHRSVAALGITRCGAGHPRPNSIVRIVLSAARIRRRYSGCARDSWVSRKRVPAMTPLAPAASAALVSDPVAIPPASNTGLPSAMASARGRNSSASVVPQRWPPASPPWAMSPSAPHVTARRAWSVGAHHDEDENPCGTEFVDQLAVTAEGHHGHVDARVGHTRKRGCGAGMA